MPAPAGNANAALPCMRHGANIVPILRLTRQDAVTSLPHRRGSTLGPTGGDVTIRNKTKREDPFNNHALKAYLTPHIQDTSSAGSAVEGGEQISDEKGSLHAASVHADSGGAAMTPLY